MSACQETELHTNPNPALSFSKLLNPILVLQIEAVVGSRYFSKLSTNP